MKTKNLFIDLKQTTHKPGATLSGEILWALEKPPELVKLSLGWFTEGRGTVDAKIVVSEQWSTVETAGQETFSFTIPAGPYSFEGHLITLKWTLELTLKNGKANTSLPLVISLDETPVELNLINEGSNKSFSFKSNR